MAQQQSRMIVGKKESVIDELLLLNPYQIPVTNFVGFGESVISTTHKWYEDKMDSFKDALTAGINNSVTTVPVDNGALFLPDSVIRIGEELMFVSAVNGNNLTVTRGYGNTTAASALDNAVVEIMFNLKDEGSDARTSGYTPRVAKSNITQIFDESIKISGTAQAIAQYGIDNAYTIERMKKQDKLAMSLENAIVNGINFESGDKRMMGGLRQTIKENVYNANDAAITFKAIDDMMLSLFTNGAMKDATRYGLMLSPTQRTALAAIDSSAVRINRDDKTVGRVVESVKTNYGDLPIIPNINMRADEMCILDANRTEIRPLIGREFAHTYLGITGDNMKGQIVGEYTVEVKQEGAHAWFKGLKV